MKGCKNLLVVNWCEEALSFGWLYFTYPVYLFSIVVWSVTCLMRSSTSLSAEVGSPQCCTEWHWEEVCPLERKHWTIDDSSKYKAILNFQGGQSRMCMSMHYCIFPPFKQILFLQTRGCLKQMDIWSPEASTLIRQITFKGSSWLP